MVSKSRKHSIYTHFLKDRDCDVCLRTNITKASCRRRSGEAPLRAEKFGDLIAADHKSSTRRVNHGTINGTLSLFKILPLDGFNLIRANRDFTGTGEEFTKVPRAVTQAKSYLYRQHTGVWQILWRIIMESLYINTPSIRDKWHRWKSRVKEGTSAVLLQSGLDESWWADSMECYTYLRNVTDLLSDGKTPYERRFAEPFKGPIIPFGALIEYHPSSPKDQARIHQFGKKVVPGTFLGYELISVWIWKGDILIADLEDLEKLDASDIYPRRIKA